MESSALLSILLPLALGIIMFGLGLSLKVSDFSRVGIYSKAIFIGLFCQMVLLPAACFGLAYFFDLSPEIAVGLILLSAAPGGVTANYFSHLAKGDVILSITLTAVATLLCIFTLPFIVNFSMQVFMDRNKYIPLEFSKILQIFGNILLPVILGMIIHKKYNSIAIKLEKPVKTFSLLFLLALIIMQVIRERENLKSYWEQTGIAVLSFNIICLAAGFFIPQLFKIPMKQSIAISMGAGVRNGTLAITIALSPALLNNSTMSIPAALYCVVMYFSAALFGYIISKQMKLKLG